MQPAQPIAGYFGVTIEQHHIIFRGAHALIDSGNETYIVFMRDQLNCTGRGKRLAIVCDSLLWRRIIMTRTTIFGSAAQQILCRRASVPHHGKQE